MSSSSEIYELSCGVVKHEARREVYFDARIAVINILDLEIPEFRSDQIQQWLR